VYCSPYLLWYVGGKRGVPCGLIHICTARKRTAVVMAENARHLLQPAGRPPYA
jgi:hypothetical protein